MCYWSECDLNKYYIAIPIPFSVELTYAYYAIFPFLPLGPSKYTGKIYSRYTYRHGDTEHFAFVFHGFDYVHCIIGFRAGVRKCNQNL